VLLIRSCKRSWRKPRRRSDCSRRNFLCRTRSLLKILKNVNLNGKRRNDKTEKIIIHQKHGKNCIKCFSGFAIVALIPLFHSQSPRLIYLVYAGLPRAARFQKNTRIYISTLSSIVAHLPFSFVVSNSPWLLALSFSSLPHLASLVATSSLDRLQSALTPRIMQFELFRRFNLFFYVFLDEQDDGGTSDSESSADSSSELEEVLLADCRIQFMFLRCCCAWIDFAALRTLLLWRGSRLLCLFMLTYFSLRSSVYVINSFSCNFLLSRSLFHRSC
jgi:hypothetical protein